MRNNFYSNYSLAKQAAQSLKFNSAKEYKEGYKEDPLLVNSPNVVYKNEWEGWKVFLGIKPKLYENLALAKEAVKKLGIKNKTEYSQRYKEDSLLVSSPNAAYSEEWLGWKNFLGTDNKFYSSLLLASEAARAIGIKNSQQYKTEYKKDSCLPSLPEVVYATEWKGYPSFLGYTNEVYESLAEAQAATRKLLIKTSSEYAKKYKQDPMLPYSPKKNYSNEWVDWAQFLGTNNRFYPDLASAQKAVLALQITGSNEYRKRYRDDPKLPSAPSETYKKEWKGWLHFLGTDNRFYSSIEHAREAVLKLGFTSVDDYKKNYNIDPRLPSTPATHYKREWQGWSYYLSNSYKFYTSYKDAKNATRALHIKSGREYKRVYKNDPKLPSDPSDVYKEDWLGWDIFLCKSIKIFYSTYQEASNAAKNLEATSSAQYKKKYSSDPKLPSCPNEVYPQDWKGWSSFLGNSSSKKYSTYLEALQSARLMGITSGVEYKVRYKEDALLPANPNTKYASSWTSWSDFLGLGERFYSYMQAKEAVIKLGITSAREYMNNYYKDPQLPSTPKSIYIESWISWSDFLSTPSRFYESYKEASLAAKALKVSSLAEYKARYKEDHLLTVSPFSVYAEDWVGWKEFLGLPDKLYQTYEEARVAAQKLQFTGVASYKAQYKRDSLLASTPDKTYSKDWTNWKDFLLPDEINDLKTLKLACKILEINDSRQYRDVQKLYKQLPPKPDKKFNDWIDWFDLLEIPKPYAYVELCELVREHKCKTLKDYKNIRISLNDPRIPSSPEETYKNKGWVNSYDFFGTPRPYQVQYLEPKWKVWGNSITDFLKSARGGNTKAKDLCEFVREYIEPNGFETSPLEYLTRGKTDINSMLVLLDNVDVIRKKKWLFSINQFLNWIITNYLTLEDSDTGEVTPIHGAKNPFIHVNFDGEISPQTINETDKLALPYQFVKSAREWAFPTISENNKPNYSDLKNLHRFSTDWIAIDSLDLIDSSDPDCVTKIEGGRTFLWNPIYWTYTYALMQLPSRGRQIIYCDSGEADEEVADFENNKIIWKRNQSSLAGQTKRQSMISKTKNSDFGVYYTSNKTNFNGEGYAIPFMPLELAYWLIKLRKWQEKYNPISEPTKWLNCQRTNLNEIQRKQKGMNCFLFRDYKEVEPGTFGARLTTRLAAAQFFSSEGHLTSVSYGGKSFAECHKALAMQKSIALTPFKSEYTPHSMRVSLINSYAYEFGMPLEVIMKLVGHSSLVMSIYYIKSDKTGANIRERMQLGEKQALSNSTDTLKAFIESQRIEECKSQLVANTPAFLLGIDNARPASSYLFKDFGICPVGGAFCCEGGSPVASKSIIYNPVTGGYLGEQNCIQCRFFITGPAFMMGLSALFNEISLSINTQSQRYVKLEAELGGTANKIDIISHQLYQQKNHQLETEKLALQRLRSKLNSEIETKAKKMDLYMSDMNAIHKHLMSCQKIINSEKPTDDSKLQLIVPNEFEFNFEINDVSSFQQLNEVCENAELYHSCSDELAVSRRSQALDKMLLKNGMKPKFIFLTEEEQLAVGNQMTQLMLSRLQSWRKIDQLMDGNLALADLSGGERFSIAEFQALFANSAPLQLVD